jgi:hypothetical protein
MENFQKCFLVRIVEGIYHGVPGNLTSTIDNIKVGPGMPDIQIGKHFGRLLLPVVCTEK